jgi:hypothetical protein
MGSRVGDRDVYQAVLALGCSRGVSFFNGSEFGAYVAHPLGLTEFIS